jgi:cytochrome P450 family 49 subfamily A
MYPVVIGNGRCMTKETVISGYKIPEGVRFIEQLY